jgi:sulfite exporter TauE/SafE
MAYGMLMLAWLSASAAEGALVMAAFGLGTLPALVLVGSAATRYGSVAASPRFRTVGGVAMSMLGLAMAAAPWLVAHPALAGIPGIAGCVRWFAGG